MQKIPRLSAIIDQLLQQPTQPASQKMKSVRNGMSLQKILFLRNPR
jgi:hypothetical protein